MGTGYDCTDLKGHTAAPSITPEQRTWRNTLVAAMASRGFVNYSKEWWHFSLPGAGGHYLIKPLNPSQILLSVKKILDNKRLVMEKTNLNYQQEFRKISMAFQDVMNHEQWADIYKKLVFWELQMDHKDNEEMGDVLDMQKTEANANFAKFVIRNYDSWLNDPNSISH